MKQRNLEILIGLAVPAALWILAEVGGWPALIGWTALTLILLGTDLWSYRRAAKARVRLLTRIGLSSGLLGGGSLYGLGLALFAVAVTQKHPCQDILTFIQVLDAEWAYGSTEGMRTGFRICRMAPRLGAELALYCLTFLLMTDPANGGRQQKSEQHDKLISGRRILSMHEALALLPSLSSCWFSFLHRCHSLVVGTTGSGKTIVVKLFLSNILSDMARRGQGRVLIYDAKTEFIPFVDPFIPREKLFILNPFDARSAAWDMAKDITAPAQAQTVAEILVPKNPRASQPFFEDATRALLTGVMIALMKNAGTDWMFRDVLQALSTKRKLKEVLQSCEQTRDLWERFFSDERTGDNVLSSMAASMAPFEFIAAAWERAERRISLKQFVESEAVIVLGNDEEQRNALDRVNQVIFRRLSDLLLGLPDNPSSTTNIVLDEVREAGKLDGLQSLLVRGRSKKVSVLLTFQEIEGLRQVYGDKVAHELTGQCGSKIFLRPGSPQTAEWASSFFGEQEWIEVRRGNSEGESRGETSGGFGRGDSRQTGTTSGNSWTENRVVKKAVPATKFLGLPKAGPKHGLCGYADLDSVGAFQIALRWEQIVNRLPVPGSIPALEPRPAEHQYLTSWSEADRVRLKLKPKEPFAAEPTGIKREPTEVGAAPSFDDLDS